MFGSDGSQQEGDDAEAARYAVARGLNVKVLIDDNDVTIAGHPSQYLKGFDVAKTLAGHGLDVTTGDGEDLDDLCRIRQSRVRPCSPDQQEENGPQVPVSRACPKVMTLSRLILPSNISRPRGVGPFEC